MRTISAKIWEQIERLPEFEQASTLLLYHSLKDEVYTHDFIEKWYKSKCIVLPVVVGDELELRCYTGAEKLATGAYGISEPEGEPFTDYEHIDLAVIPGVAFDLNGNRLGRGKGYYDRFLPLLPHACKIGVCFPFQLVDSVPAEPFDIRMDIIITTDENKLSHSYHSLPACDR